MTKPPRKSPGVGRGQAGDNISDDAILSALATEILDQEAMDLIKERRKKNRKRAEGNGVPLADLDALYKMRDEPIATVLDFFRRRFRVFGAFFTDLRTGQTDMFAIPHDAKAALRHAGMMAGLKGQKAAPPPTSTQDEIAFWMEGYEDGADRREASRMALLNEGLGAPAGQVVDGTPGAVTERALADQAAAVGTQAAADFQADNPPADGDTPPAPEPELDVDAAAKKLEASGFTGNKPGPKLAFRNPKPGNKAAPK